jgi:hypothetical protein
MDVTSATQRAWAAAIRDDFPPEGDITCDPRVFMPLTDAIVAQLGVRTADPRQACDALTAAAQRFLLVDHNGREHTSESLEAAFAGAGDEDDEPWTTPYVSEPRIVDGLAVVDHIDTEGEFFTWAFRTYLRITAEELRRAGTVPAHIEVPLLPEVLDWVASRGTRFPTDAELG